MESSKSAQVDANDLTPEGYDPELERLPKPPKRERTLAAVLMACTAAASIFMCWSLRAEIGYAFANAVPKQLGDLAQLSSPTLQAGAYVEAHALLGMSGAIRYARPLEGDSFRLQPVAGNPKIWVEVRVPQGTEGPRFVPPTRFAGKLAPLSSLGIRYTGLARSVEALGGTALPPETWILSDGSSPRASRWAVAMCVLFAFFAAWNLFHLFRILRPTRLAASS